MKSLAEIIAQPHPKRKTNITHHDSKYLLKIPPEQRSPQVWERLIQQHKRLVEKWANYYWRHSKAQNTILTKDDLIASGNYGLFTACKKYRPELNNEFSTYAVFWIKQAIQRDIMDNGQIVRIPTHFGEKLNRSSLHPEYFSESNQKLELYRLQFFHNLSLDSQTSDDGFETLKDYQSNLSNGIGNQDRSYFDPEYRCLMNELNHRLIQAIKERSDTRNYQIMMMRFGLGHEDEEKTLEETGNAFGITRERVRQVCNKVIGKLQAANIFCKDDLVGLE